MKREKCAIFGPFFRNGHQCRLDFILPVDKKIIPWERLSIPGTMT